MRQETIAALAEYYGKALPDDLKTEIVTHKDTVSLQSTPDRVLRLLLFLRDDGACMFKVLTDICGVDYPEQKKRFEVVYNLLSLKHNRRIRVKVQVADGEEVPSATGIYSAAGWFEREVFDMYGVRFSGNPDLRRILTDYGFEGHPQRKDFPQTGYKEVRYDIEKKRVVYEPVVLRQEFRSFDFLSPWEGTDYRLPGDEKATKEG
ncbi:MAG: NADH-quinone oxidoreductase subunit C [Hyphomicrobiales bacterium]|nr:NADH-quinone oxidoreductase subunit C [Hyphomicrobiales bacterium]